MSNSKSANKVAVITGGSRGIGRAIASRLAASGFDLLLVARNADVLKSTAEVISAKTGRRVETCAADLRKADDCNRVLAAAEALGSISVLVNNAGATRGGPFLQSQDEAWEDGFALKFHAAVRLSRLLWPLLSDSGGTVINIAGAAARTPGADFMIGGAVNAALANFAKALAELGLKSNVNVNTVHPGMTTTERLDTLFADRAKAAGITIDESKRQQAERDGIRRLGQPDDVASLVAYLCSPDARHINGAAIAIDGGATRAVF